MLAATSAILRAAYQVAQDKLKPASACLVFVDLGEILGMSSVWAEVGNL